MSLVLTTAQKDQLQALLTATNYPAAYDLMESWTRNSADPDVQLVHTWLLGAADINRGEGPFSALVLAYNQRQGLLRGRPVSAADNQLASNRIAESIIGDALASSAIPSFAKIVRFDADGGASLYESVSDTNDTAKTNAANWTGTFLISPFGQDESGRLLSAGSENTLDRLDDMKNVLFAYDALQTALRYTVSTSALAASGSPGAVLQLLFQSLPIVASLPEPGRLLNPALILGFSDSYVMSLMQGRIAESSFSFVKSLDKNDLLDHLISAWQGQAVTSTTDSNFLTTAATFFAGLSGSALRETALERLDSKSADELAALGKTSAKYRNALLGLSAFALELDAGQYASRNLNLYDQNTGEGEITNAWLTDRSQFLAGVIQANINDSGTGNLLRTDVFTTEPIYFKDEASGLSLQQQNPVTGASAGPKYLFGGTGNDTLWGGSEADHLFGGTGMDRLDGGQGDDYLEGNAGSDSFTGGKGNDTLIGGKGLDTYIFKSGDGWDWIEDQDRQGALYYDNIELKGGTAVGDTGMVWQKKDGNGKVEFTYILSDWTVGGETFKRLSIQGENGGVWIKDWKNGDLGITLPGAPEPVPPPTVTTPTTVVGGASASYLNMWGSYSNFTAPDQSSPIRYPNMQAGAGNAYIDGNYASDIKGGAGSAWIVGRAPDNTLSTGTQTIQGGQGDTFISTGAAEGTFIGGDSNTLIDARYYRTFRGEYAWNAIGSAFTLSFGWQASSAYRPHVAYDLGYFDPGQTPDTSGLDWLGYVDTAGLLSADESQIYVAQPGFGNLVINGQDPQGHTYSFDPLNWTITVNGNPGDIREWVVPILAPKKQTLIGGKGDNVLLANDAGNILIGGGGTNVLMGGKGNDKISAGNRNDIIDGGAGDDFIEGGAGDSQIYGGRGSNVINGGSGNESIFAGVSDADWASAGAESINRVAGNDGNDTIYGTGGVDTLLGGLENDVIRGGNSNDVLDGGAGNDYLDGGDGDDQVDGGIGNDVLLGGKRQDLLQGGAGDDEIRGEEGNDTLVGGSGSNRLLGGSGDDRYVIDSGSQNFVDDEQGNDTLVFGAGIDMATVVSTKSSSGNQLVIDYGTGKTTINNGLNGSIERFQTANGSTLSLREFLNATLKTPVTGSGNTDGIPVTVYGGGGSDYLTAGSGDRLIGGQGNDTFSMVGADASFDFQQGDGQDSVLGASGVKNFSFVEDAGILASSARLSKAAPGTRDLLLTYGEAGDSIFIEDSVFSINQTYSFADGTVLTQRQLLEQSEIGLDWLGTASDEVVSGTSNGDRLLGDSGNDTLSGLDGNDWLEGGDGRDILSGGEGDDILVGGRGDDKLYGGTGDDTLIGGAGANQLSGGAGHDVYVLEHGTYNEIVDQDPAGEETIRLPQDMHLADFCATRLDNDLIIQNLNGDTATKIVGYFAQAVDGKTWFVSSELEAAKSLHDWVTEQIGTDSEPGQAGGESQRAGFEAALKIDLGQQGALGKTIGNLTDFSSPWMSMYFDQNLGQYLPFEYSFGGVVTTSISMTEGLLVLDSSESDSVVLNQTTKTVAVQTPIYETWASPGLSYVVTPPAGASVPYPHGATLTDLNNGSYQIDEPGYWHSVVVGESVYYREIPVDTDLVTRTFTITNVQGTDGNDTVMMGWQQGLNVFRGTVVVGEGNDRIDLGTTGKYNDDWFSGADWGPSQSYSLGAYIDGGNGADTLIGTDGNDVLVAGLGDDLLDGGRGADFYHVSLDSAAQDLVYDSGNPGGSAFTGWVYGGQFPLDVLVFDAGVTVQNLSWRLIENSIYDGYHALEIVGGKGKIIVVFDDAANPAETESAIGVERFQFADGTVLTRADFMAQVAEVAAPTVHGNLSDVSVAENAMLSYLIPDATFSSATGGDYLSYQVQLANDDPLPDWLTFDPITRTLSGAPGIGNLNEIALQVRAVNAVGEIAATSFVLSVTAAPGQNLLGTHAADTLVGMSGDDTINGGTGADILIGGLGNDTYWVDRGTDQVIEAEDAGTDTVIASLTFTLPDNVENLTLSGSTNIKGYGNALDNLLIGNAGDNRLFGEDDNDTLYGNTGVDQLSGGSGDDLMFGDAGDDELKGGAGNDRMDGGDGADLIYGANGDDIAAGGSGNDYLLGGNGQDTLDGGLGNDIVDGANSADTLSDLNGNNCMLGGANSDTLTSGAGNDLLVGGSGNDTIISQGGQDVILFNQGDGYDKVTLGTETNATVSLGGGIAYGDLTLKKSASDLILGTGNSEGIVFKAWYSSAQTKNVQNLQVIAEAMAAFDANSPSSLLASKVQEFDFKALVNEFDRVRSTTTGLSTWAISDALTQFHISGSDSLALGGDLAYQYGKNGTLAGINLSAAQSVIDDSVFGAQAQTLKPLAALQGAAVTL